MIPKERLTLFLALFVSAVFAQAQAPEPDPGRFADEIESFAAWDRKNSYPKDGIVFVGSSSIRRWNTASAFPDRPVINRGFGGSQIADVNFYYDQVVKPYRPAMVVLYAGDNDIGSGKSPERVLADFQRFSKTIQSDLPDTRVLFLSIKPSFLRWEHWPTMVEANSLIKSFMDEQPNMTYVDVASPLLNADGQPRDVFVADGLHLNDAGNRLWQETLAPYLH